MRYALIIDGIVENVILSTPEFNETIKEDYDFIIQNDAVGTGYLYDGIKFTNPSPAPEPAIKSNRELKRDELKDDLTRFDSMTDTQKMGLIKGLIEVL